MPDPTATANSLAHIALYLWIAITILLFTHKPPEFASAISITAGFLLLPELISIQLPGLPAFDKGRIACLAVLLGILLKAPRGVLGTYKPRGVYLVLFWWGIIAPLGTVLMNGDALHYGKVTLIGLTSSDLRISVFSALLDLILPFWLGHVIYRNPAQLRVLLGTAFACALGYTLFALIERLKGPILNSWLYGYAQHDFFQTVRAGGFRPMVFTSHGLTLAKFFAFAVIVGFGLARQRVKEPFKISFIRVAYVAAVLSISNSLGALIYVILLAPLALFGSSRRQLGMARWLVLAFMIIPVLRAMDVVPVQAIVKRIAEDAPQRADSLLFRFNNEDMLLEKWSDRPWFGWGPNARSRVITPEGEDISVTDGDWIIALGVSGIIGVIGIFGPAVASVFSAARLSRFKQQFTEPDLMAVSALAMGVGMILVDNIPNATAGLPVNFWAGALAGTVAGMSRTSREGIQAAT